MKALDTFSEVIVSVSGIDQYPTDKHQLEQVLVAVVRELLKSQQRYGKFHSPHEGYAVIKEELEELWDDVKANKTVQAKEESVQVAAMGIRFILDI